MDLILGTNKNLTKNAEMVKSDIKIKYWTAEHINNTINNIIDIDNKMLITLLWRTGLRITELLTLTKQDINFEQQIMRVKHLKSRKYTHRIIPLHYEITQLLNIYTATLKPDDRIFPITRQRADQIIKKYFGEEGYCHRLRHSFAVHWIKQGGDIVSLHRMLGHSNIKNTMEYLKICPIDLGKELHKIDWR